jgi:glycosyltransferase involved in cell wall biosynthesis
MRIAVDLQSCQTESRDRGIGRYVLSLVEALARTLRDCDELVICIDATNTQRLRDVRTSLRNRGVIGNVVAYSYPCFDFPETLPSIRAAAGQLRSKFFKSICPDMLLITSILEFDNTYTNALDWDLLSGVPTAAIAYDLIPLVFPDKYLPKGELRTGWYLKKAAQLKHFDVLFAISERTRRDLIERLGLDPLKIKVVGAGFDNGLRGSRGEGVPELKRLGIRRPFVLMVANGDWRKNTIGALCAFSDLPGNLQKSHQLVLTQAGEDVRKALMTEYRHLQDRVLLLGKVHESTLGLLYSNCKVFYFPSFYEGFGLPVLEAMALGAPALSSCLGSLPEVVHNPEMLFDPRNRNESSAILKRALEDEVFLGSLSINAKEHAKGFSWERCAHAILDAARTFSQLPKTETRIDWPTDQDISTLASACLDAGSHGEQLLKNGLEMIENGNRRRVLVDITDISQLDAQTGIQRVTRNFCVGLADVGISERHFMVEPFVWTESGIRYARNFARNRLGMDCTGADDLVQSYPNDLVFMLDSSWLSPERFDILHRQTWELGGEVIWMVYDLIPIKYPKTCGDGLPAVFRNWLSYAVNAADGFICISDATRLDLESFIDETLPAAARRPWSRSVHLGSNFTPNAQSMLQPGRMVSDILKQIAGRPYFVTLGTLEPRKDQGTAIDAMERLWRTGTDVILVLIGKKGWNVDELVRRIEQHQENGRRLFWLEGATDGDVQCLLKGARALIQTSISEGFGLPLVEAGSQGVPLVLSDIPVFHEVAGEEAVYFPVGKSNSLASAINQLLRNTEMKRPEGIKAMTWRESSSKLASILL